MALPDIGGHSPRSSLNIGTAAIPHPPWGLKRWALTHHRGAERRTAYVLQGAVLVAALAVVVDMALSCWPRC
jgi:hypothetical protein